MRSNRRRRPRRRRRSLIRRADEEFAQRIDRALGRQHAQFMNSFAPQSPVAYLGVAAVAGVAGIVLGNLLRNQAPTLAVALQQGSHALIGRTIQEASQLIDELQKDYEAHQDLNDVSVKDWSPSEPHVCCGKGL